VTRRLLLVAALLGAAALVVAGTGPAQPAEGPEAVRVAFGEDPSSTLSLTFRGPPAQEALVELAPAQGDNATARAEPHPLPGTEEVGYRALAEGLEPGTAYAYEVRLDGATTTGSTSTAPAPGGSVGLTAFGDHGVAADRPTARHDGDAPRKVSELAANLSADVHLHAGDLSYADGDAAIWERYFERQEVLWGAVPTMSVPGNHEREPGQGYANYDARTTMPEDDDVGRWWSVQAGNVQVIGLNSDTACTEGQAVQAVPTSGYECGGNAETREPNEDQLAFLEGELQAAEEADTVDWTVVVFHDPMHSTAEHGSDASIQDLWRPVLEDGGADLVVNGHDHVYQRTTTVVGGEPANEGPMYIVHGAAGSGFYEFEDDDEDEDPPAWEAARANDAYGVLGMATDGDRLEGWFVTLNGTIRDRFVLEGGADGPPSLVAGTDAGGERGGAEGDGAREGRDDDAAAPTDDGDEGSPVPAPGAAALLAAGGAAALAGSRRYT